MEAMGSDVALVVVDMQEYFCCDSSAFARGFAALLPEESEWYQQQVSTQVIPTIASLYRASTCGRVTSGFHRVRQP